MQSPQHRQFLIHDCLGRGGFGEVYRATMISPGGLKTSVALKLLRLDVDPSGDAMSRLRDEGRLLATLRHPAILRAYDLALLDGRIGLVTEYVEGQDLHGCVGSAPDALSPRAGVQVIGAVAEALDAAWNTRVEESDQSLQLVHRDIKPSNIRLGRHGEVKLLDFGIARSDEVDREARTGTGSTVGSLSYMAPERFSREAPGPEADIYALGCTLYEVLSGRRLHQDPVPVEMFRLAATAAAHHRHVAEALDELDLDAPKNILRRMLDHDKTKRPTAGEVAHDCDELQEVMPGASLKRWARGRAWPDPARVSGSFDGREITEGTLGELAGPLATEEAQTFTFDVPAEPATTEAIVRSADEESSIAVPAPIEQPNDPMRMLGIGAVVLLVLGCAGLIGGAVFTDGLVIQLGNNGEESARIEISSADTRPEPSDPTPVPTPPEPPSPEPLAPEPAPPTPPPVAPTPVPVPEVLPVPVAPPEPVPEPEPIVEPDPVPAPEPVVRYGTFMVKNAGGIKVWLVGSGKRFEPGPVPEGTYNLMVDGHSEGVATIADGVQTTVSCNGLTRKCSLD